MMNFMGWVLAPFFFTQPTISENPVMSNTNTVVIRKGTNAPYEVQVLRGETLVYSAEAMSLRIEQFPRKGE